MIEELDWRREDGTSNHMVFDRGRTVSFIKKHPIRPTKKPKGVAFDNIHTDYKWRGEKGAKASKKARKK